MLQALDEVAVRRWAAACCDALAAHREEIDRLNVFPVPDSDTGTNLLATMRAGLDAVLRLGGGAALGATLAALARGALLGARGNSGVILSQVLRGLAEPLVDAPTITGAALRDGLLRADELAAAAVAEPAPGTVLSVLHAAAAAARACPSDDLVDVAGAATRAAGAALAETPRQLAALARAGVVDAGGRGLVLLLEVLLAVVTGRSDAPRAPVATGVTARSGAALEAVREAGSPEHAYEVMYLLDGTDEARAGALRAELGELGDCVAVVGSGGAEPVWTVHVHCSDVGAAIELGVRAGRPHRITVLRFADQVDPGPGAGRFTIGRAVVALVPGGALADLVRAEGAVPVPDTAPVAELLAALAGTRARSVTVLPCAPSAAAVAEAAAAVAREDGQDVAVVATASPVQALAALAVHDPARRAGADVVAMAEAAAATRRGELAVAAVEALTWAGRCRPGDVLGLVGDEVVLIADRPKAAARELADRMLATGGELLTALVGRDAPAGLAEDLAAHVHRAHPEVELAVHQGGQASLLLVGVE